VDGEEYNVDVICTQNIQTLYEFVVSIPVPSNFKPKDHFMSLSLDGFAYLSYRPTNDIAWRSVDEIYATFDGVAN
jgi:hypothetical protein